MAADTRAQSAQSRGTNFPDILDVRDEKREAGAKSVSTSKERSPTKQARMNKRKSLSEKKRLEEIEREKQAHELVYRSWEAAKKETREEDHELLKQKLQLQRQLLQAQLQLADAVREEEEERKRQERDGERRKRTLEFKRLQEICRQSLKEDREARQSTRARKPSQPAPDPALVKTPPRPKRTSLALIPPLNEDREPTPPLEEEEEEEEEEHVLTEEELASLPWHHIQLYQLYGARADDYLHPKIEQKEDRGLNPRLVQHMKRKEHERPDAGGLWLALREDSKLKLLKEDSTISRELKETFGAFARQCLRRQRRTVQRNFNMDEDVPDLKILLDERQLKKAHRTKHKVGVMFRSAQSNEDRAKILCFNNPIPDLNNLAGGESIERYMPSWAGEEDTESVLSYKKWLPKELPRLAEADEEHDDVSEKENSAPSTARSSELLEEWSFMEKKPRRKEKGPKILFITEKDTTVKGEFSKRHKEMNESKGIPEATVVSPTPVTGEKPKTKGSSQGSHSHSAPPSVRRPQWGTSPWQPLSLGALMEYKERMETLGQGDYQHGRTRMWSAVTTYD